MVREVKPHQVTLVPDPPDAITSNAGWDTVQYESMLSDIISDLKSCGIRTSIFVDTELKHIEGAAKINTDRIELYTESYANYFLSDKESAIAPFIEAATLAYDSGLGINAGHDLSLVNLAFSLPKSLIWMKCLSDMLSSRMHFIWVWKKPYNAIKIV